MQFFEQPTNEPILAYAPETTERRELERELSRQAAEVVDIPVVAGGERIWTRTTGAVSAPHNHTHVLAKLSQAGESDVRKAIEASTVAQREWANWSLEERAAVFLKAADLLSGPWRARLNAATMLGQSKTAHQAEIDSACELADFLRFNVAFARQIQALQPMSSAGVRNSMDFRPLEGFVYAITPFNFTAIGGNLACAPALMGNSVLWKPAATASLSNYLFFCLLEEAGLPPGVINFIPGDAAQITNMVLSDREFAGLHFTGSTAVFDMLWRTTGENLLKYDNYPRLVGETGGKDFIVAHPSADVKALSTALLRGAFEYQGQKCSAASRAYIPRSIWNELKGILLEDVSTVKMGDVADLSCFMGAVIDANAVARISRYLEHAKASSNCTIIAGGNIDDSVGYFVEPTIIEVSDPHDSLMTHEIFGPVLGIFVYNDSAWQETLKLVNSTADYALTGSVFARDRKAISEASCALRFAAGNFYINDKPTGAVVGQQPFGGARRSGTNDKAGSPLNLLRWTSPRTVKESYVPATRYGYPHMS